MRSQEAPQNLRVLTADLALHLDPELGVWKQGDLEWV